MVARGHALIALAFLSVACAVPLATPTADALGSGDPGMVVAESAPVRLADLAVTPEAPPADAPTLSPAPSTDAVPDAARAVATPSRVRALTLADAPFAEPSMTELEAIATLADSGLPPEVALRTLPTLARLVDAAEPEVAALTPALAPAVTAPAVATGLAGAAAVSVLVPPTPAAFGRFYSRIAPRDVLKHPVRRRVYETIRENPGVHMTALREALGLGNGGLLYHLDVLTRERLVTKVDAGRFTRYFVSGTISHGEMRSHAALLSGSGEKLFKVVRGRPGVAVKDLADEVGLSVPAVHRALARLESAGLVEKRREGRGHALYPAADAPAMTA